MSDLTEQRLGWSFGLLGGLLFLVGALVSIVVGTADLATGHLPNALGAGTAAVLLFALGGLSLFFSLLARRTWQNHPITAGVMLVVIAAVGWVLLGLGGGVLALLGALFVFLAGVLFLVQPALTGVKTLASA